MSEEMFLKIKREKKSSERLLFSSNILDKHQWRDDSAGEERRFEGLWWLGGGDGPDIVARQKSLGQYLRRNGQPQRRPLPVASLRSSVQGGHKNLN